MPSYSPTMLNWIFLIGSLIVILFAIYMIRAFRLSRLRKRRLGETGEVVLPERDMLDRVHILQAKYELLGELSEVCVVTIEPDIRVEFSPNALVELELEEDGVYRFEYGFWEELVHPDDKELWDELLTGMNTYSVSRPDNPYVLRLKRSGGDWGEFIFRFKPLYTPEALLYAVVGAFVSTQTVMRAGKAV